jgi:hypothetical protein
MPEKFQPGNVCEIVELGPGALHRDAKENFVGKKVEFVSHGKSSFDGKGFIACTLRLLEDICTNQKTGERMLKGHSFYFPCVKLVKATS